MWIIGELAIFYAGGVNVPLSVKLEESSDLTFPIDSCRRCYDNGLRKTDCQKSGLSEINFRYLGM